MKNRRSMILAFALPFLIVGGLTVWHWYDYGLQDMHTARAKFMGWEIHQPGDEWESLKFALIIGSVCGAAAGIFGVAVFGLAILAKRKH